LFLPYPGISYGGFKVVHSGGNISGAPNFTDFRMRPAYSSGVGSGGDVNVIRFNNTYPKNFPDVILVPSGGFAAIGPVPSPAAQFTVSGSSTTSVPTALFKAGVASPAGAILDAQQSDGTSVLYVSGSSSSNYVTAYGVSQTTPSNTNGIFRVLSSATNALIMGALTNSPFATYIQSGGGNQYPLSLNPLGGSVGIGTTSPSSRFYITGSSTPSESVAIIRGGAASPTGPSYVLDVQRHTGTSVLLVSGSGNVGIGAAPITFPLHVFKGGTTAPQISAEGTSGASGVAGYNFKIDSTDLWQVITDNNASNGFYLQYNNSTSARYLSVSTVGNIGIGTTIPNSNAGYTTLTVGSTSTGGRIDFNQGASAVGSIYNDSSALYVQGNSSEVLVLGANASEAMRINTSSNVGIGTATYTARLFVSGTSTASTPTIIVREGVANPTGGVGVLNVQNSAGTSILFVTGSGRVGVGTITPQAAFHVVNGTVPNAANLYIGYVGSNNYYDANTHFYRDGSGNTRLTIGSTGNTSPGSDNTQDLGSATLRWANVFANNIVASGSLGPAYTTATSTSGDTAIYDTISVTLDAAVYELMIMGNPNLGGSGNYMDVIYGKIIIGTGWNGSAATNYIQFVRESPDPRALYPSGGGPLTADVVYFQSSAERTNVASGSAATVRVKVSGYVNNTGYNTTVRLKRLM
jgi:hypothetical protein